MSSTIIKPKRVRSSYIWFAKEIRPKYKKKYPNLTFGQIAKKMGTKWKNLSKVKKKRYYEMSEKDRIRYENEVKVYKKILKKKKKKKNNKENEFKTKHKKKNEKKGTTKKGKKDQFLINKDQTITHKPRTKKKNYQISQRKRTPVSPRDAFFFYSRDNKETTRQNFPDLDGNKIFRKLREQWSNAGLTIKNIYQQKETEDKKRFQIQMKDFLKYDEESNNQTFEKEKTKEKIFNKKKHKHYLIVRKDDKHPNKDQTNEKVEGGGESTHIEEKEIDK
ncbi:high mobility group protein [Anaeramoeba flamelloides]|uniref:High mobility group protein n=1 Tax=Anaeramoeba flamelloides TaxID=1746091 RepID=A0AAV7ZMN7_9EUKA|nr:high mobility group protein [Anaeramoeba flamelloides]